MKRFILLFALLLLVGLDILGGLSALDTQHLTTNSAAELLVLSQAAQLLFGQGIKFIILRSHISVLFIIESVLIQNLSLQLCGGT